MNVSRVAVLLVLLGFSAAAAAKDADYFPLTVGREEHYVDQADIRGMKMPDAPMTVVNVGTVERNGKVYTRTEARGRDLTQVNAVLMRVDDTGVYQVKEGAASAVECTCVPFPLKVGSKATVKNDNGNDLIVTVVGYETVTVDGKSYENCLHLRTEPAPAKLVELQMKTDEWRAANVGVIKTETVIKRAGAPDMIISSHRIEPDSKAP